jgi:UDP-N-acetylglucosamine 4-epimerase
MPARSPRGIRSRSPPESPRDGTVIVGNGLGPGFTPRGWVAVIPRTDGSICPACAADYDNNGGVDGGDLAAFFADFETGETCADVDGNGGVDGGDVHGSVLDDEAVSDAIASRAIVFHLAAVGSVPRSIEQPQRTWSVNATGTLRVLEAARAADATRVVIASSSSVYGDQPELPKVESMPLRPRSPYAASKAAVEHLAGAWSQSYGLSTACLRYFNVFGPRQAADNAYAAVVAAFAKRLLGGMPPVIYGDGSATRDFTYVSNAVLATLLAGCAKGPLNGQAMNIGTGSRISIGDLAVEMAKLAGAPQVTPKYSEVRVGDVAHSMADIGRAKQLLGYEPVATVQQGLADTLEWYKGTFQGA